MTETCIVCANRPDDNRVGSIGKPFEGIEVAIAEDGEMLVRGPEPLKVKRRVIDEKYGKLIQDLYAALSVIAQTKDSD